jgi:Asp-tRNA(Asn)/Glu-tRNA(Gln) amidotransferase A subunit family amidase
MIITYYTIGIMCRLWGSVATRCARAVARLREAGAVILGHTNVPIMAGDWQSYNKVFGTTNVRAQQE